MKPKMFNFACAHPQMISWFLGATALNITVVSLLVMEISQPSVLFQPEEFLPLALALISATSLGYFAGMFICWPWMRPICSRYNGAPFQIGDEVVILAGPLKGKLATVYEITVGQGGWNLLRLKLTPKSQTDYSDIFEEYTVIRRELKA